MIKAVITGDLVNSTKIEAKWRQTVIDALNSVVDDFSKSIPIRLEMYRGDSFQIETDDIDYALSIAIAIRAKLRSATPDGEGTWDARLAIGIGEVEYESESILTSDGEAFRLSGHAFDGLGKRRLVVATRWADMDDVLALNTKFADETINSWTVKQARVVYAELLTGKSQKNLAEHLGMSPQNMNYIWNLSKCSLILEYIEFYKQQIDKHKGI